jgi:hypothetical protein
MWELFTAAGLGFAARLGVRELIKLVPYFGTIAGGMVGAALGYSYTYALGKSMLLVSQQRAGRSSADPSGTPPRVPRTLGQGTITVEIHAPHSGLTTQRSLRAALAVFLVAPCGMVLLTAGVLFLWENPWLLAWLWVPIFACWLLAWALLRFVKRRWGPVWQPGAETPLRWSETDHAAWDQVVDFADRQGDISQQQFFSTGLYRDTITRLANRLAEHYHGATRDAVDALTIPKFSPPSNWPCPTYASS